RSALLEDYRLNKTDRNWGLNEILGHIIEFSGDQHGSRLIQSKLEHANEHERGTMFAEILPNALTLMTDVFGNYVIQKFFDFGSAEQVRALGEKMRGQVLNLSMQMYGCRVVQKALERVEKDQKLSIIAELDGKIVDCVKSANANHRIIQCDPPKSVPDAFAGHALELSVHAFGCRVLQKAVENLPDGHKAELLEELHGCAKRLIEDAFGNYVVQSMIIAAGPDHRARVIQLIKGQVWTLSCHKFASNIVEKAILHAEPDDKRELVYELVAIREDGSNRIHSIIRDPFANFVLQVSYHLTKSGRAKLTAKTCLKSAERAQRQQVSFGPLSAVEGLLADVTAPGLARSPHEHHPAHSSR
ncbi:armadillo-type protein, partial [Dioszegia hungarica]